MNLEQFKGIAVLVKEDERYRVYDYLMTRFTVSLTELNPQKETVGHSHRGEETYVFIEGEGKMKVGGDVFNVKEKDVVLIQSEKFHRVINPNNKKLKFFSVFRRRLKQGRTNRKN